MLEKVLPSPHSSWRYWLYELENIEFNWHYHPEYEIALSLNSKGQRYVGDNIELYDDFDLALLGPYLPHTWCTDKDRVGTAQQVYVAQIPVQWLNQLIQCSAEFEQLKKLLDRSSRGVRFSIETSKKVAPYFIQMDQAEPMQRLVYLLQIFQLMIEDSESRTLSSLGYGLGRAASTDTSADKLDKIINYIYQHYMDDLRAEQLADMVHMSTNHFHRFIKQRTEQTFVELVNQLRISKACSMLINSKQPVSVISDLCGFNNLSNFNRRFLQFKNTTPSQFRKNYLQTG